MAVIENRQPPAGAVTGVTGACRHKVAAGLARCRRAVVTGRTGAGGDGTVIERRWDPGGGGVAAVARGRRYDVIAGLARCRLPVMTADTRARCALEAERVVVKTGNAPYGGRVTQITLRAGWDVIRRFNRRRYTGSARVAAGAESWCALEYSPDMARFTSHRAMGSRERKACLEVIEFVTRLGRASLVLGQL
jgi:hypothetical protein